MKNVKITADKAVAFRLFDSLLERWNATPKKFPFDLQDAFVPQKVIPNQLRRDVTELLLFYFYVCLYMRGGIRSLQAFRALLRMRHDHPKLFDPFYIYDKRLFPEEIEPVINEYVGWDSQAVARFWIENSIRLVVYWEGDPLNLIKDLRDYETATLRLRNKMTKRDLKEALAIDRRNRGFMGKQPKMVSMEVYFWDWESLLEERFSYPSPADYQNFRIGLGQQALLFEPQVESLRADEDLSVVWRSVVQEYLEKSGADPVDLSDVLWLFPQLMCGSSPLTLYTEPKIITQSNPNPQLDEELEIPGLFDHLGERALPHDMRKAYMASARRRNELKRTCLACPFLSTCRYTIPAAPYYQGKNGRDGLFGGHLWLWERPRIENEYEPMPVEHAGWTGQTVKEEMQELFADMK